jgi:hypothetical protein
MIQPIQTTSMLSPLMLRSDMEREAATFVVDTRRYRRNPVRRNDLTNFHGLPESPLAYVRRPSLPYRDPAADGYRSHAPLRRKARTVATHLR